MPVKVIQLIKLVLSELKNICACPELSCAPLSIATLLVTWWNFGKIEKRLAAQDR